MNLSARTSEVSQSELEHLGHKFDAARIFELVRLRRCRGCGRIWRFKAACNSTDAFLYAWLRLLEPTGWTMTFDLPLEQAVDDVLCLSRTQALLWNGQQCGDGLD
jgi:hypothetical protein